MTWRTWVGSRLTLAGNSSLWITLLSSLAGMSGAVWMLCVSGPFQLPHDDPYITLEFARNMAATGRFSFDGVHLVGGATSLLHVMILAVPARFGLPLDVADVVLGILFFVFLIERTAAMAWRLTQSREASWYAALTTALTGYLVFDSLNGLETTLFMCLTVTCVGAVMRSCTEGKGYVWPAFFVFLTALTRPEGMWLAVSLVIYLGLLAARRKENLPKLAKLAGYLLAGVLLTWLAQWMVLGTLAPHTALAKVYLYNQFRLPLHTRSLIYAQKMRAIWEPLLLLLFPGLWMKKARPLAVAILPWMLITQIMFWLLLPHEIGSYHGRYMHPLMPFLFIMAGDGLSVLLHKTGAYRIPRWSVAFCLAALAGIFYFNFISMQKHYVDDKTGIRNNHFWVVDWLKSNAPPGILVATHDIGVLRYSGHFELVDVSGLTDEEAMARNRAEHGQLEYLLARRPDYLVGDLGWFNFYLHYFPALNCCATLVATAHPNAYESLRLQIFRLRWDAMEKFPARNGQANEGQRCPPSTRRPINLSLIRAASMNPR